MSIVKPWDALSDRSKLRWLAVEIMDWHWFDDCVGHEDEVHSLATTEVVVWPTTVTWPTKKERIFVWVLGEHSETGNERPFSPLQSMVSIWEVLIALQAKSLALFNRVAAMLIPESYRVIGQGALLAAILQWEPAKVCQMVYEAYQRQQREEAINEIAQISQDAGCYD